MKEQQKLTNYIKLVEEWHPTKNGDLKLSDVTSGTHKKVWWMCEKGHEWEAPVYSRVKGSGCPYCAGKLPIKGENDLGTTHPLIAKEWHPTKNNKLSPCDVSAGSGKKVWWMCEKGHEWEAAVYHRTNGRGCPYCNSKKILRGYNDLGTKRPDLVKEWHPTKNGSLTPYDVALNSDKVVWWMCEKGHEWEAAISVRNSKSKQYGCPYCSNKRVLKGYNDLGTINPDLAKEWHPTKNGSLTPFDVTAGSGKKAWWMCEKCGHEWEAYISNRSLKDSGCPNCTSQQTSFPEQTIFYYIKNKYGDSVNRYKKDDMELDIYIPSLKVGIEYDGVYYHKDKLERDNEKDTYCKANGIKLIRIREEGLLETKEAYCIIRHGLSSDGSLEECIEKILLFLDEEKNNKVTVNIRRDFEKIMNQYYESEKEESLSEKYPNIAKEWHPTKNGQLNPSRISGNSKLKVWWICEKGHEWRASVANRTTLGRGCPYCANKQVLKGYNDLGTINPDLAKEWHPTKNGSLTPFDVTAGSGKKVWWMCEKGHEWEAPIHNRKGCPYCSGRFAVKGLNDLGTTYPEIAREWHPTKNGELKPEMVATRSVRNIWWKCEKCGEEWCETVRARVVSKKSCPNCGYNPLSSKGI